MAKKFFYNRVYNTKRTIINLVIIGVCVIGIIICFIITSNFQGENKNKPEGVLNLKKEATVEVNEKYSTEIFFSKIENVDLDEIKISYPQNYDISTPGKYKISLDISGKRYTSTLVVVDTIKPELEVKEVKINEGSNYAVKDFVSKCSDNSNHDCKLAFAQGMDEDGNKIDYSSFTKPGTYTVKISAKDDSENETVKETKLTINKKATTEKPKPTPEPTPEPEKPTNPVCKYGNNVYNKDQYLLAIDVTSNNCAISLDLYKDTVTSKEINKLMETETTRLRKDVEALNLTGTIALNRKITAVLNTNGDGIVGYELRMSINITDKKETKLIADYKLDANGKRVFISNPYKLDK